MKRDSVFVFEIHEFRAAPKKVFLEGVGAGEFLRLAQVASRYEKVRRVIAAFLDEGEDLGFLGFAESADGAVLPNERVELSWLLGITVELQPGIARFFGELAIKTDKERRISD